MAFGNGNREPQSGHGGKRSCVYTSHPGINGCQRVPKKEGGEYENPKNK